MALRRSQHARGSGAHVSAGLSADDSMAVARGPRIWSNVEPGVPHRCRVEQRKNDGEVQITHALRDHGRDPPPLTLTRSSQGHIKGT